MNPFRVQSVIKESSNQKRKKTTIFIISSLMYEHPIMPVCPPFWYFEWHTIWGIHAIENFSEFNDHKRLKNNKIYFTFYKVYNTNLQHKYLVS